MGLMQTPDPDAGLRRVEAARYALLRRLALAMRHHMVVHLQPIGLITQVIERRLRDTAPDVARIGTDLGKVHDYARSAVAANLDVVSWLAPDPGLQVALEAGVAESVALLRSHFSFRGFQLLHESGGTQGTVPQAAVRTLLPAVLFGLTDAALPPADVLIRAGLPEQPALHLHLRPATGSGSNPAPPPYRLLAWDEVEALAEAEGALLARDAEGVRLQFGAG